MSSNHSPPGRVKAFLASATALITVFLATLVFGSLAVLLSWVPPRGWVMLSLSRVWSRFLMLSAWSRVEPHFEVPLDAKASYVFLANHQSYFDIPALLPVIPGPVRFAAKHTLFKIPIFGSALRAGGFISIDRRDRSRAVEAFSQAVESLRSGGSVLFFPEGTRSADGRLARLERGGVLLALRSGLPIVPVGIRGTREIQPRGRWAVHPNTVTVCFGSPVDVAEYGLKGKRQLHDDVRAEILRLGGLEDAAAPQEVDRKESATFG